MKFGTFVSKALAAVFGIHIGVARRAHVRAAFPGGSRRLYQEKHIDFAIAQGARVLDIGCGPAPFHRATVVCDKFPDDTVHRRGPLTTHGLPFVEGDIHALPFKDKEFDFVYCAHVLEHIDDPIKACTEMMRVGKRGYLETPNFMKDALFCQAGIMAHRWHTVAAGNTLFFFEYTPRQREGIRSRAWHELIWSRFYHPLQDAFVDNQDIFNTMFLWTDRFNVVVVMNDGTMRREMAAEGARP